MNSYFFFKIQFTLILFCIRQVCDKLFYYFRYYIIMYEIARTGWFFMFRMKSAKRTSCMLLVYKHCNQYALYINSECPCCSYARLNLLKMQSILRRSLKLDDGKICEFAHGLKSEGRSRKEIPVGSLERRRARRGSAHNLTQLAHASICYFTETGFKRFKCSRSVTTVWLRLLELCVFRERRRCLLSQLERYRW